MFKQNDLSKLLVAVVSLSVGGLIYVLWRSETLMMFTWFDHLCLASYIAYMRAGASELSTAIPTWIVFSLPNALWFFSGLLAFDIVWGSKGSLAKLAWLWLFWIVGIGSELGQAFRLLPGTFDWNDMALMTIGGFAALSFIVSANRKEMRRRI